MPNLSRSHQPRGTKAGGTDLDRGNRSAGRDGIQGRGHDAAQDGGSARRTPENGTAPPAQEKAPAATTPKTEVKAAKPEPSKKAAPKASGAVEAGLWYVQVGALDSKAAAQTHGASFRKQGYNVVIRDPFATDRRPVYRVWLGGYATKAAAQDIILKLNAAAKKRTGYYPIKG